jgi:phenylalanyl-tRNA synthetase beta chain
MWPPPIDAAAQEDFEALCFDFGIELDDVTTEKAILRKEKHLEDGAETDGDDEVIYKIEVAANRWGLFSFLGSQFDAVLGCLARVFR